MVGSDLEPGVGTRTEAWIPMESRTYWGPVCSLRSRLRCWVRLRASDGSAPWTTDWGMLLTLPRDGYLEAGPGPVPIRHVEWVEIATMRVKGGIRGLPLGEVHRGGVRLEMYGRETARGSMRIIST